MPRKRSRDRKIDRRTRARAALLRAVLGAALIGLVASLEAPATRAADDTDNGSVWSRFMQKLGLQKSAASDSSIKYTERPPLVVPPTRDLPPPMAGPPPMTDWPKDDTVTHHKHPKPKVVVDSVPGPDGEAAASTTPRVPNPPVPKKSFFNPSTWFSKEEYATFTGEPPRENLADPPTGYRTPSPSQPYGVGPDRKGPAKAKDAAGGTPAAQAGK